MTTACPESVRPFVTPREFAEALGFDERTVRRWCKSGWVATLPTPGTHFRIPRSEIERFRAVVAKPNP